MPEHAQMMKRQQVLADFGDLALQSADLDHILTEACRHVSEALGTKRVKILELQHEEGCLLVRAGVGWEAAREQNPNLLVILITGYAGGMEMPDMDMVDKLFDPVKFGELVRAKLDAIGPDPGLLRA